MRCSKHVWLDFETRSLCDLKKFGGRAYARHPSTQVFCCVAICDGIGWAWGTWDPVTTAWQPDGVNWRPWSREIPEEVVHLAESGATFLANNGMEFDRHIWNAQGYPPVRWLDTMNLFRRASLPGGLDAAAREVTGEGKDEGGARTLRALCRPNKRGVMKDPDAAQMRTILKYCAIDVMLMRDICEAEGLLADNVDDPVMQAHQAINDRGMQIDTELAERMIRVEEEIKAASVKRASEILKLNEADTLTALRSPKAIAVALRQRGYDVPDARADTLDGLNASGEAGELIAARRQVNRVAGGKFRSLLDRVGPDGRLRGALLYCDAHTWRWTSKGVQVHNLKRWENGFDFSHAYAIKAGERSVEDVASELGCSPADVLGYMVRPVICGDALTIVDLDQIEARVQLWLAGDEDGLAMFVDPDRDPYVEIGASVGQPRQVGKTVWLGLQFGGGDGALRSTMGDAADDYDIPAIVEGFRDSRPKLAGRRTGGTRVTEEGRKLIFRRGGLWKNLDRAVRQAISRGAMTQVGRLVVRRVGEDVLIDLPSGRPLRYRRASVVDVPDKWGTGQHGTAIQFYGPVEKRGGNGGWGKVHTYSGKLAENCTQAVARDVMASALVRLEQAGFRTVAHVHDEVVVETDQLEEVKRLVAQQPEWAEGLSLGAGGKVESVYGK